MGQNEEGGHAIKQASHTIGVIGGGIGGFLAGGPPGAYFLGIAGGAAVDAITTGVESVIKQEYTPSGILKSIDEISNQELESAPTKIFDTTFGLATLLIKLLLMLLRDFNVTKSFKRTLLKKKFPLSNPS